MIGQHWFRSWLPAIRQQAITWAKVDPDLCHQMASLGLNELKKMGSLRHPQWYYFNKINEPAHMVKNNSRRDLPILTHYKRSQYNQRQLRNPTDSRIKFSYFSKAVFKKFPDLWSTEKARANMSQRESNAENVSIWWRHHEFSDVPGNRFLARAFLNQCGFNSIYSLFLWFDSA